MAAVAPLPLITVRTTYSALFSRRVKPLGQPSLADYLRDPCGQLRTHYKPGTVIYTHFALEGLKQYHETDIAVVLVQLLPKATQPVVAKPGL